MSLKKILTSTLSAMLMLSCFTSCGNTAGNGSENSDGKQEATTVNATDATYNEAVKDEKADTSAAFRILPVQGLGRRYNRYSSKFYGCCKEFIPYKRIP